MSDYEESLKAALAVASYSENVAEAREDMLGLLEGGELVVPRTSVLEVRDLRLIGKQGLK